MDFKEKKRRNRIFIWAIIVVAVNLIAYSVKNQLILGAALMITVYGLYTITIKDKVEPNQTKNKVRENKKNN